MCIKSTELPAALQKNYGANLDNLRLEFRAGQATTQIFSYFGDVAVEEPTQAPTE